MNKRGEHCSYEGCDRFVRHLDTGLCAQHRRLQKHGQPLRPLRKAPSSTKYGPDAVCKYEGCTERPVSKWLCVAHYSYYHFWESKQMKNIVEDTEFPRTCTRCGATKDWKKFPDADGPTVCRDCWRTTTLSQATGPKNTKYDMFKLLEYLST